MGGFANNAPLVTDGLVFYVDAGNSSSYPGSGTTWTDLIGSNDGTLTNGPTYSSANAGSIAFDGSNDWSSHSSVSSAWPVTMSCWAKFDSFNNNTLMAQSDVSASNQFFGFGQKLNNSQNLLRIYNYTVSFNEALGSTVVSTGQWYNITAVFESNTSKKLYLNGALEATLTVSHTYPTGIDTMSISSFQRTSPGGYHDGDIACAMVHNKALSADEVLQNYNALKNRFV